jgi:hypothetical protein
MKEQLAPFRSDMEAATKSGGVIEQGSLLWRIVYDSVLRAKAADASVCIVRHEDLSLRPMQEYARLYETLGLSFNERARRIIAAHTGDENPKEGSLKNPFKVRLDSRANLTNWQRRLDADEIDRISLTTRSVAERFYGQDEAELLMASEGTPRRARDEG